MNCKRLVLAVTLFASPLALAQNEQNDHGDRQRDRKIVTVAFGAGMNTAQPGNEQNHHVVPGVIRVNAGDVVSFVVSGLHVIRVYDNGVRLNDVKAQIPDECEVNPTPPAEFPANCFTNAGPVPVIPPLGLNVYYEGLNSIGPPPQVPPFAPLSLTQNPGAVSRDVAQYILRRRAVGSGELQLGRDQVARGNAVEQLDARQRTACEHLAPADVASRQESR